MNKNRLKTVIFGYETRVTAIISNGLVHRAPKRVTIGMIRNELNLLEKRLKLTDSEKHDFWNRSLGLYNRISKKSFSLMRAPVLPQKTDKTYDSVLKLRKNAVYETVRNEFRRLEKEKNDLSNAIEYRAKTEEYRNLVRSGVFYLCSSHIKPAKDHADWEGKIYVSKFWRERIDDDRIRARVEAYIRNHDIKTVEWVTGSPVWLIFRPNCKHYFISVPVEEVLSKSCRSMLKQHGGYMQEVPELSYEETQYKFYYERLKVLVYLKSMFDCDGLDKDIAETRKLVRKWYGMIRK